MASPKIGEKREKSPSLPSPSLDKKLRFHSPKPLCGLQATDEVVGKPANPQKKQTRGAKKHRKKLINIEPCSHDDVYWHEVISLLGHGVVAAAIEEEKDLEAPFAFREEIGLEISRLSSNGEGLAIAPSPKPPWLVIVPFSLPGEKMLSYETQLDLKRDIVVRAYEMFSGLPSSSIPTILPTAPSPLQYGYRTKITPHFDAPVKTSRRQRHGVTPSPEPFPEGKTVPIGFNKVGTRDVLDIEECPIATPVINNSLGPLRKGILEKLHTYKKGVSLLLRDSLPIRPDGSDQPPETEEERVCVTDHRGMVREKVGDMLFDFNAGSFFQNNNSVLFPLVEYVRNAIFPSSVTDDAAPPRTVPTHLVDAYCGAGLFSIMLSPYFRTIAGIELSSESIAAATRNAELNKLPTGRVTFRAGDASHIFASVPDFPPSSTAVIIDPPRKGCDENFLDQLLAFRSTTVVYVSCNVHTQARDVGILLRKSATETEKGEKKGRYVLESVRGYDLFPQTAHVESVAVLRLV